MSLFLTTVPPQVQSWLPDTVDVCHSGTFNTRYLYLQAVLMVAHIINSKLWLIKKCVAVKQDGRMNGFIYIIYPSDMA